MKKHYCDICGVEMLDPASAGGIMRQKAVLEMMPGPEMNLGLKNPGQMGTNIIPEIWELCKKCEEMMWKIAEEQQKKMKEKDK